MPAAKIDPDRTAVVAQYGAKPLVLAELIRKLQASIQSVLGDALIPRPIDDVHSTIVGLDVRASETPNRNLPGLLRYLQREFRRAPFTVQYGGFGPADRRMLSRGKIMHERSLTVNGDKVVLIGWAILSTADADYTTTTRLASVRRGCEQFGVQHKYHTAPHVDDPDSYLVLGEVADDTHISAQALREAVSPSLVQSTRVLFDVDCLSVIQYVDFALPRATSDVWTLDEAIAGFDADARRLLDDTG
jgi:hypothetical protein